MSALWPLWAGLRALCAKNLVNVRVKYPGYLDSCRKDPGVPVPVAGVAPSVSPDYAGSTGQLELIVDETGKPAAFSVKSNADVTLARPGQMR